MTTNIPSKQDKILQSALELFVEFGFHGTPTSKIAKEAGVSNGILFHYFKTKEELIITLYVNIKEEILTIMTQQNNKSNDVEKSIKESLVNIIIWALENKKKYYYVQQVHFSPHIFQIPEDIQTTYIQPHIDLMENAKSNGLLKNLSTEYIFSLISGQTNALYDFYTRKWTYSKKEIQDWVDLLWEILKK